MLFGVSVSPTAIVGVRVQDGQVHEAREPVREFDYSHALTRLFPRLLRRGDAQADSPDTVVFDVSAALSTNPAPSITVVRIAPRPPIDVEHELATDLRSFEGADVTHVRGGHNALGEELARLDLEALAALAASRDRPTRYVITSVGSLAHPQHEIRAEQLLSGSPLTVKVESSRSFHSSSFATRERTALVNQALLPQAEALGTTLALVAGEAVPRARLYVATNDGGRAPLSRLSVTPVHSLLSGRAAELVGAAAVVGVADGQLIYSSDGALLSGEMLNGVPAVTPFAARSPVGRLATQSANTHPVDPATVGDRLRSPSNAGRPLAMVVQADAELAGPVSGPMSRVAYDLRAFGAACTFHTEWINRFIRVANPEEMTRELALGEARVTARLIDAGAPPSQTRIVESRVETTAYETANVVAVRVRGIAGDSPRPHVVGDHAVAQGEGSR